MKFKHFAKKCEDAGLRARDCGQGHWRIEGGVVAVNWYPLSKGSTVWVNGTTGRTSFSGSAHQAISAARGQAPTMKPGVAPTPRRSQKWGKHIKRKWWRSGRSDKCHWCRVPLKIDEVTVDHVVPLHRGGANIEDNLVPACHPCNKKRGHELGAPKEAAA